MNSRLSQTTLHARARILVAVAGRHGATGDVAERIGEVLRANLPGDVRIDVRDASEVVGKIADTDNSVNGHHAGGGPVCQQGAGPGSLNRHITADNASNATAGYDAAVIGSAVYGGHWLEPARRLVHAFGARDTKIPLWLFSSGPMGDPLRPASDPAEVAALMERSGARGHIVFAGRLYDDEFSLRDRAALSAPYGDFRDWAKVQEWARGIAADLVKEIGATAPRAWPESGQADRGR